MAKAVKALQDKKVNRIILTRRRWRRGAARLPAGTLYEKIDPYLRRSMTRCTTWSIPTRSAAHGGRHDRGGSLAYMRGRTLNDSFIILDEAQNTSPEQMKMFLTRLGFGSKVVVTGDVTQVDLPTPKQRAARGAGHSRGHRRHPFLRLNSHDVVRTSW